MLAWKIVGGVIVGGVLLFWYIVTQINKPSSQ